MLYLCQLKKNIILEDLILLICHRNILEKSMYSFLVLVTILISILLIIAVLLQASKGDGLAGTIAGGAGGGMGQVFGARKTADFLSKITWYLGTSIIVLALVINLFFLPGKQTQEQRESIIQQAGQQVPTSPNLPPEQFNQTLDQDQDAQPKTENSESK